VLSAAARHICRFSDWSFRESGAASRAMKVATIVARILLGLIFVVFGLNIFLHFIPMPPMPDTPATQFGKILMQSHYMLVVGALQAVGGLLLLLGRYVPLGLVLLGPVIVNILLFHIFLQPSGFAPGLVAAVLALFLLWRYRSAFAGLLQP
jgi:putative oxidoreductase